MSDIDPPYRLDPFQNLVKVSWKNPHKPKGGESTPGPPEISVSVNAEATLTIGGGLLPPIPPRNVGGVVYPPPWQPSDPGYNDSWAIEGYAHVAVAMSETLWVGGKNTFLSLGTQSVTDIHNVHPSTVNDALPVQKPYTRITITGGTAIAQAMAHALADVWWWHGIGGITGLGLIPGGEIVIASAMLSFSGSTISNTDTGQQWGFSGLNGSSSTGDTSSSSSFSAVYKLK